MRGTRALKFRSRDSPFERELGGNSSRFKAYLRTQIFETVLFAGLWRGNGTRVERGEKKRKERLKGERKREEEEEEEEERRTGLCFVPCNCDTYGSVKGFCTPVPQLGSVTWIALLCSFLRELFLN